MKHARILIIEDDADTADMLKIFFSSQGSSLEVASTGKNALAAVGDFHPDLILLDIMLPDIDGYAVCQKLRGSPKTRHIPIIFLTQRNTRRDILSGLEIGADDYLTKPFDLEELKLRVRNALRRSRTYRQIDARTSLPSGDLIGSTLTQLLSQDDWAAMLVRIGSFYELRRSAGIVQTDELLGRTAAWLENLVHDIEGRDSFVGYLADGDFLLLVQPNNIRSIQEACFRQFPFNNTNGEDTPANRQLQLEIFHQDGDVGLELGVLQAGEGPFESVTSLLDALFEKLDEHTGATD